MGIQEPSAETAVLIHHYPQTLNTTRKPKTVKIGLELNLNINI